MDSRTVAAYDAGANAFAARYDAAVPESLHRQLLGILPPGGEVLEIGCGSGRDARMLASHGFRVTATDASGELLRVAAHQPVVPGLVYQRAAFPLVEGDPLLGERFDAIVATAVVMHISDAELFTFAFQLRTMLRGGGKLLISTSEGHAKWEAETRKPDGRLFIERAPAKLQLLFERLGFRHVFTQVTGDSLGRESIRWHALAFELVNAAGQTPINQIETIISRDAKTATYKFALLRAIADIAQVSAFQARWHGPDDVSVPLGLVVEKWVLYYWPLLEAEYAIRQIVSSSRLMFQLQLEALIAHFRPQNGLAGFYTSFVNDDLDDASRDSLDAACNKVATAIIVGPVTFAGGALGGNSRFFWHSGRKSAGGRCRSRQEIIQNLGRVHMRADVWREMCLVGHWIAEAIPMRWAELSFEMNKKAIAMEAILAKLLVLPVSERDQMDARRLFEMRHDLACVWTGRVLSDRFDIDHVIPFSLWHNNDLWNLLPASREANAQKSDRLITRDGLYKSRDRIIDYWQFARKQNPFRFDVEINRALIPGELTPLKWENDAFTSLVEAVETTAIRRGVERWNPEATTAARQGRTAMVMTAAPVAPAVPAVPAVPVVPTVPASPRQPSNPSAAGPRIIPFHEVGDRRFRTALPFVGRLAAGPLTTGFEQGGLFEECDWIEVEEGQAGPRRFIVKVAGDSMSPTLNRGDYCIFEYHRTPRRVGQIVIVLDTGHDTATGEVAIKRFHSAGEEWVFTSDNPEHGDVRVPAGHVTHPILGILVDQIKSPLSE